MTRPIPDTSRLDRIGPLAKGTAQARVLAALADVYDADGASGYLSFRHIGDRSGLPVDEIRLIVRSLAARGLAVFGRGLWTADGEIYGSGYALTKAGLAASRGEGR